MAATGGRFWDERSSVSIAVAPCASTASAHTQTVWGASASNGTSNVAVPLGDTKVVGGRLGVASQVPGEVDHSTRGGAPSGSDALAATFAFAPRAGFMAGGSTSIFGGSFTG